MSSLGMATKLYKENWLQYMHYTMFRQAFAELSPRYFSKHSKMWLYFIYNSPSPLIQEKFSYNHSLLTNCTLKTETWTGIFIKSIFVYVCTIFQVFRPIIYAIFFDSCKQNGWLLAPTILCLFRWRKLLPLNFGKKWKTTQRWKRSY